jgi:hypothetical protein
MNQVLKFWSGMGYSARVCCLGLILTCSIQAQIRDSVQLIVPGKITYQNPVGEDWVNSLQKVYSYNVEGWSQTVVQSIWDSDQQEWDYHHECGSCFTFRYGFNEYGDTLSAHYSNADNYHLARDYSWSYDSLNRLVEYYVEGENPIIRYEYIYDSLSPTIQRDYYRYDSFDHRLEFGNSWYYELNEAGDMEWWFSTSSRNVPQNPDTTYYEYNENGDLLSIISSSERYEYEFDDQDRMVGLNGELWSSVDSAFRPMVREELEFNGYGDTLFLHRLFYNTSDSSWFDLARFRREIEVDAQGRKILQDHFIWDTTLSEFTPDSREIYEYDTLTLHRDSVPAYLINLRVQSREDVSGIRLETNMILGDAASIRLFDAKGNFIRELSPKMEKAVLSDLPQQIYFAVFYNTSGQLLRTRMVNHFSTLSN